MGATHFKSVLSRERGRLREKREELLKRETAIDKLCEELYKLVDEAHDVNTDTSHYSDDSVSFTVYLSFEKYPDSFREVAEGDWWEVTLYEPNNVAARELDKQGMEYVVKAEASVGG